MTVTHVLTFGSVCWEWKALRSKHPDTGWKVTEIKLIETKTDDWDISSWEREKMKAKLSLTVAAIYRFEIPCEVLGVGEWPLRTLTITYPSTRKFGSLDQPGKKKHTSHFRWAVSSPCFYCLSLAFDLWLTLNVPRSLHRDRVCRWKRDLLINHACRGQNRITFLIPLKY